MKTCSRCKQTKPLDEMKRNRGAKGGFSSWCKACHTEAEKRSGRQHSAEYLARWYVKNKERLAEYRKLPEQKQLKKERSAAYHLKKKYKLSRSDFQNLKTQQNGKCAICQTEGCRLSVDHNHTTGAIRGLLCVTCNSGIGFFRDSIALLTSAVRYLQEEGGG